MLCSALATDTWQVKFGGSPHRGHVYEKLENGSGVDIARWCETDLTRMVLEWWYEELHGRQPDISLAV